MCESNFYFFYPAEPKQLRGGQLISVCVYLFNGFLGNLCFEGLKPIHDVPKSCASCGI